MRPVPAPPSLAHNALPPPPAARPSTSTSPRLAWPAQVYLAGRGRGVRNKLRTPLPRKGQAGSAFALAGGPLRVHVPKRNRRHNSARWLRRLDRPGLRGCFARQFRASARTPLSTRSLRSRSACGRPADDNGAGAPAFGDYAGQGPAWVRRARSGAWSGARWSPRGRGGPVGTRARARPRENLRRPTLRRRR
jgi:hypothetical protein